MSVEGELLVLLVMAAGLVGIVVPVLPGLLLIWGAGIFWAWADGGGARWAVAALLTLLLVGGSVAKYTLPARSASGAGAPRRTLVLGALGAVAGFFVIPVAGLLVGGVAAVFLAEWQRLGEPAPAWRSTRAVLVGVGIGLLVELATGVLMIWLWVIAAVLG
ncbi:MAG: DUF456 domain-containing protein [Spirochaetaceae bacterium]|nr:DUF456 domain-containing protein [Spirochaetaceae bacterium]